MALAAVVAANEAHPDCESGQADKVPMGVRNCEGEHWDGQDPTSAPCVFNPDVNADADTVCLSSGYSNGAAGPNPPPSALNPLYARASVQYGGDVGVYSSQGAWGVGQQSIWVGADGTVSWYGRDGTNDLAVGSDPVFEPVIEAINPDPAEGGADGNIIAWAVGAGCDYGICAAAYFTGEADCNQSTYETYDCYRDNTAVTVELIP